MSELNRYYAAPKREEEADGLVDLKLSPLAKFYYGAMFIAVTIWVVLLTVRFLL